MHTHTPYANRVQWNDSVSIYTRPKPSLSAISTTHKIQARFSISRKLIPTIPRYRFREHSAISTTHKILTLRFSRPSKLIPFKVFGFSSLSPIEDGSADQFLQNNSIADFMQFKMGPDGEIGELQTGPPRTSLMLLGSVRSSQRRRRHHLHPNPRRVLRLYHHHIPDELSLPGFDLPRHPPPHLREAPDLPSPLDPYSDHNCWERSKDMDTSRAVYKIDKKKKKKSHPGSDMAGEIATALTAASIVFRSRAAQQLSFCPSSLGSKPSSIPPRLLKNIMRTGRSQ
ncbi:hypothetical protein ACFX12_031557 [Malus domestica]